MAWPARAPRTRRDLTREAQRAGDEEAEHDGSADGRDDEGQCQDERMRTSPSGGRDSRGCRGATGSWSARGCRAPPGSRTARGCRAPPRSRTARACRAARGSRTARRCLTVPGRVVRRRLPCAGAGPRRPRMTEATAAEREAPCERRRRRSAGRPRGRGERPRRGRAQSRRDDQDRQDERPVTARRERPGTAAARRSGTGAPGRRHVIVTGVPIGSSRPSARIAALRSRMQPWEIRPGISPGSSVPWMPMNPPAGQSVS